MTNAPGRFAAGYRPPLATELVMPGLPRSYQVVRRGIADVVTVPDGESLWNLRTELELVRRFGAGRNARLIAALDARLRQMWPGPLSGGGRSERSTEDIQEMRAILCDAMAPVNARTLAQMDQDFPEIGMGMTMESLKQDTEQFRTAVAEQVKASEVDDVDSLLAQFEQATTTSPAESPSGDGADQGAANVDPIEAALAEAANVDPIEAALAEAAKLLDEPQTPRAASADLASPADHPPTEDLAADILSDVEVQNAAQAKPAPADLLSETDPLAVQLVQEYVAAQELDAIASAFEVAATELEGMSQSVAAPAGQPAEAEAGAAAVPPTTVTSSTTTVNLQPPPARPAGPCPSVSLAPTAALRGQLQQARSSILSELDEVLVLLQRLEQMQNQAEQCVAKARTFEEAAAKAQQAGQDLAAAEAEAATARAAFETAQARAEQARQTWAETQQRATAAAKDADQFRQAK